MVDTAKKYRSSQKMFFFPPECIGADNFRQFMLKLYITEHKAEIIKN